MLRMTDAQSKTSIRILRRVLRWYFGEVYGKSEGPGTVPFYCDPGRVGHFAVDKRDVAAGSEAALFRMFVTFAMFQARRDVLIMGQQRGMVRAAARSLTSVRVLRRYIAHSCCEHVESADGFDAGCSVRKSRGVVDCDRHPNAPCHVKDGTRHLRRMGDMGKLPTSAWLHVWSAGGVSQLLAAVLDQEPDPQRRADLLVDRFSRIHRVGSKLATMYVSALSTPSLANGAAPWFPRVDGSALVVVDTNVARAVTTLCGPGYARTYAAQAGWLREKARAIDLGEFRADVPRFSPRLVQQSLYAFCSKSNRVATNARCARPRECPAVLLCPFCSGEDEGPTRSRSGTRSVACFGRW